MTQQQYLDIVRSLSINVSVRNCNLIDLGYPISDVSLIQLQFLSLLEQCFKRIDIFNEEQINNLNNILNYTINMENIDNSTYNNNEITLVNNNDEVMIIASGDDIEVLKSICIRFASYGGSELSQCKASCGNYNQTSVALYNMFNSALCAKTIGSVKLYQTLIKYLRVKLELPKIA